MGTVSSHLFTVDALACFVALISTYLDGAGKYDDEFSCREWSADVDRYLAPQMLWHIDGVQRY